MAADRSGRPEASEVARVEATPAQGGAAEETQARDVSVADAAEHLLRSSPLIRASIGPRRFRRGCGKIGSIAADYRIAFNRAATFPSRMLIRPIKPGRFQVASIGPRRFRRGCAIADRFMDCTVSASIGPRRFRRGCIKCGVWIPTGFGHASIGPRRFRRGCAAFYDSNTGGGWLQ